MFPKLDVRSESRGVERYNHSKKYSLFVDMEIDGAYPEYKTLSSCGKQSVKWLNGLAS